jgi:hypothetical protein
MSGDVCLRFPVVEIEDQNQLDGALEYGADLFNINTPLMDRASSCSIWRARHTIAATKQLSDASNFLCRTLNHSRTANVLSATKPKTKVLITSW